MKAPRFSGDKPLDFDDTEYQLIIINAGYPNAFTLDQTVAESLTVMPDSSATRRDWVLTSPTFVTKTDRLHWEAGGRQAYASSTDHAGALNRSTIPTGAWSFTPHGAPITFRRARNLPTSPQGMAHEITRLFGAPRPPAAFIFRQYGFLLASAPLTQPARKAVLEAVGALPGIHMCGALFPRSNPRDIAFCVSGNPTGTGVLLDRETGTAVVVCQRLDLATPLYPNLSPGALVQSDTFSLQPSS
jgi:hypothetical protein